MNNAEPAASLRRRFAAMLYDAILLAAVLFLATIPPTLLNGGAIQSDGSIRHIVFTVYLLAVWFLFYGWFWTHGGQTLGMLAWRIKAVGHDNRPLSWRAALIRWSSACLGLANLSKLFDRESLGWHERLSSSRTLLVKKAVR